MAYPLIPLTVLDHQILPCQFKMIWIVIDQPINSSYSYDYEGGGCALSMCIKEAELTACRSNGSQTPG